MDSIRVGENKRESIFAAVSAGGEVTVAVKASRGIFTLERNLLFLPPMRALPPERERSAILRLTEAAAGHLREKAAGLKAYADTSRTASAALLERAGFLPAGFLFGTRSIIPVAGEPSPRSDRRSLVLYARRVRKENAGPLYLPVQMRGLARKLYNGLGVPFSPEAAYKPVDFGEVNAFPDERNGVYYLRALECGENLGGILRMLISECSKPPHKTILLRINAGSPSAPYGYARARAFGFWFAGFDPLDIDFEYILMYYGGGVRLFFDEMRLTKKAAAFLQDISFASGWSSQLRASSSL